MFYRLALRFRLLTADCFEARFIRNALRSETRKFCKR